MLKHAFFVVLCVLVSIPAAEAKSDEDMSMPRFAALRSGHVNSRSGPGRRYPIEWVYTQKHAPVEVVQAYEYQKELWYKVRDWENSESWIISSMITKNRTARIATPGENNVYEKPDYQSEIVAKVESEVVADIIKCPKNNDFCQLDFKTIKGWVPRKDIFGVYPKEEIK